MISATRLLSTNTTLPTVYGKEDFEVINVQYYSNSMKPLILKVT